MLPPARCLAIAVSIAAIAVSAALAAGEAVVVHLSPTGDDAWSGRLAEPDAARRDGPVATPGRARDVVRALRAAGESGPVNVRLRAGTWRLAETLVFAPEDSGRAGAPTTWEAAPGERVVLSGGLPLPAWTVGADGVWTSDASALPDGFRQLWMDGQRRSRSRLPKTGFFTVAGFAGVDPKGNYRKPSNKFEFAAGDIDPAWSDLTGIEAVVLHFWVDVHLPIKQVDAATRVVEFRHASRRTLTDDFNAKGARYYLDNVGAALAAGEWHLDRASRRVRYQPRPGEDAAALPAVAARLRRLLDVRGDAVAGRLVEHLIFRGLEFAHQEFELPPGDAGDLQAATSVPGAVLLTGARDVTFERCAVRQVGGYGVQLEAGCTRIALAHCRIEDIGGGGVRLSGGKPDEAAALRTHGNTIADCTIAGFGRIWHSGVGILCQHSGDNAIVHNHIHDGYYTAISAGWIWGYKPSAASGNRIEGNRIHDIGQKLLSDMGGIYLLGPAPGTVVRGNLIHDVDSWGYGGWGIYTDEGSSEVLIENNVVHRTKTGGFHQHYGRDNIVRNNVFAFARQEQLQRTRIEKHRSFTFERNLVLWNQGKLFNKNWTRDGIVSTGNLYWNPKDSAARFAEGDFAAWQATGLDAGSLVADPGFADPAAGDFGLRADSPALKLGFKAIDLSGVGPRP